MSFVHWPGPVVVRSTNWLGDAVMTFPAVRNLKAALGDQRLTVAVPAKFSQLWELCPFVDEVLPLPEPRNLLKTAKLLRAKHFAAAVVLPSSLRSAAEARLAGIPQVYGYAGHSRRWLLTRAVKARPFDWLRQHHSYYYLDLIEALTGIKEETFPPLRLPPGVEGRARQVALCPGAEYGPAKRWLPERFAQVATQLHARYGWEAILLGAGKDVPASQAVAQAINASWVKNLTGKTDLHGLIAELARSQLVVSNDSGSMHLAAALGVPTVGIYGSTDPNWTSPLGPRTQVVRHHVPCSPCFLRECPLDFACMRGVSAERVVAAAAGLVEANVLG